MKQIVILGSTGSIGTQTLDIVARHPERFAVAALAAGRNVAVLAEQIRRFRPRHVVVADEAALAAAREAVGAAGRAIAWGIGPRAMRDVSALPEADIVVAALVGAMGLAPTYAALAAGKCVALANKETLVVAGALMRDCAKCHGAAIIPVDSEHSAVFQALQGHRRHDVAKVTLTASGGPFRERPLSTFPAVTAAEALAHPNWSMGPKVTIDSATMMNKGLEVIEARWLFDLPPEAIDIVLHPQSIVHALVEYVDGSVLAQLAHPDMRGPIAYALAYPERVESGIRRLSLATVERLTFAAPDPARYPCLALARAALLADGSLPAVMNAANEVAVTAFLDGRISFPRIAAVVEATMGAHAAIEIPDVETALVVDREARRVALEHCA
ncbi:MAG: 1-deoxy-D-xylulose-5-phosphate reductoisomerase [Deltaproteobacteria bacterium]|nr:1-deoxy-D-xylulose-5-phosphate reductoisomerase [Deltaproteobacteria bacterium]